MEGMEEAQARLAALIAAAEQAEARVEEWSAAEFAGVADEGGIVAVTDALGTITRLEISPRSRRRLDATGLAAAILAAITTAEEAAVASRDALLGSLHAASGRIV
ncbi:YbaB/EbfC family nucleoid-associated protein [Nonomuraea aurantiaca]|jgi:DNA-binding protein YbaB|uniref:YbaB/EbfC family nucleoid-associated protein n=1 Tax=Nonomuraea aurantiaca TaxID=2878562 RepID=UPI001CD9F5DF|nr:YbaB/EbfC family nucleoid-associated protein [Nonomuraea aurantiaca]MCA2220885.1 YbaB/EbfC family nucleoid-associated protein [Nonomuraea aurantiaca]